MAIDYVGQGTMKEKLISVLKWCKGYAQYWLLSDEATWLSKIFLIRSTAKRKGVSYLIETGTNKGQTLAGCIGHFSHIWSCEIDPKLFNAAKTRFQAEPAVSVSQADSGDFLRKLIPQLPDAPLLFFLDAHYSGGDTGRGTDETPVERELEAILPQWKRGSAILIDDAKDFGGNPSYPTFSELKELFGKYGLSCQIERGVIVAEEIKSR